MLFRCYKLKMVFSAPLLSWMSETVRVCFTIIFCEHSVSKLLKSGAILCCYFKKINTKFPFLLVGSLVLCHMQTEKLPELLHWLLPQLY